MTIVVDFPDRSADWPATNTLDEAFAVALLAVTHWHRTTAAIACGWLTFPGGAYPPEPEIIFNRERRSVRTIFAMARGHLDGPMPAVTLAIVRDAAIAWPSPIRSYADGHLVAEALLDVIYDTVSEA